MADVIFVENCAVADTIDCDILVEDVDDVEVIHENKRICTSHLGRSRHGISQDAQLALHLQAMEQASLEVADSIAARCLQNKLDQLRPGEEEQTEIDDALILKSMQTHSDHTNISTMKTNESNCSKLVQYATRVSSNTKKNHSGTDALPAMMNVKLYTCDMCSIIVKIAPRAVLLSLFSDPMVAQMLCRFVGLETASAAELGDRFNLHRPAPKPCVFDRSLMEQTSISEAVGECGGVLRIQSKHGTLMKVAVPDNRHVVAVSSESSHSGMSSRLYSHQRNIKPTDVGGECDRVEVLRLRTPDGQLGSPIVLVKNFNCDRGILLARLTGLKEMVEMAPEARKTINDNVRNELDSYKKTRRNFTTEVRRASDRVLELGEQAVRQDPHATAALAHRTEYASTAVLVYEKGTTLPRHIDNCGHWVTLFSFGITVEFFAGDRAFSFESGDALIFNGSTRHSVTHGIDRIHKKATLHGKTKKLPDELAYMNKKRASFQNRQGDA